MLEIDANIEVADLDRGIGFYCDGLGLIEFSGPGYDGVSR